MLTGIAFLLALVGVIVVVIWEITNDTVGLTEETWGLLRMQKERPAMTSDERGQINP